MASLTRHKTGPSNDGNSQPCSGGEKVEGVVVVMMMMMMRCIFLLKEKAGRAKSAAGSFFDDTL
jgi:hypothetical protein